MKVVLPVIRGGFATPRKLCLFHSTTWTPHGIPTDEAMQEEIFHSVCYRCLKVQDQSLEKDERILFLSFPVSTHQDYYQKMNHYCERFVWDLHG